MIPFLPSTLPRLYIILDPSVSPKRRLVDVMRAAISAGATLFQYRNKLGSMRDAYAEGLVLRRVAAEAKVLFLINDRCDLALAVDADGVHLGQEDLPIDLVRKVMGPTKLIGLSTHNSDQVQASSATLLNYLAIGPIFTPGAKHDHEPVIGLEAITAMKQLTSLPVFAIGGIQINQVATVIQAGANGVAVISAVLNAINTEDAVTQLLAQIPNSASLTV